MSRSTSADPANSSLILRVKAEDSEAWDRLAKIYGPLVYRWARQAGLQASDAADVGQEVFTAVSKKIEAFRRDKPSDSFRGWLWGITRNKLCEHHRHLAAQPASPGGGAAHAQMQAVETAIPEDSSVLDHSSSDTRLLQRTVTLLQEEFEPLTWQAFWELTFSDLTASEIGAALGMTAKAVRQAKYRVICRLRKELDQLLG